MNPMLSGQFSPAAPPQGGGLLPPGVGGADDQGDAVAIPLLLQALQALLAEQQPGAPMAQPAPYQG